MTPADHWHDNSDGTAWIVFDDVVEGFKLASESWRALDRPCDECQGIWPHCLECDGTGRHTFEINVDYSTANGTAADDSIALTDELHTFRVSVIESMVLPIYDADDMEDGLPQEWMSHITIDSFNAAQRWWRDSKYPDEWADEDITLPSASEPGMYAVKLKLEDQ